MNNTKSLVDRARTAKQKTICFKLDRVADSAVLRTDGKGLWTYTKKEVSHTKLHVCWYQHGEEPLDGAEVRVFFTTKEWDTSRYGLIYTDQTWLKDFRRFLVAYHGFTSGQVNGIHYSEHGMQGRNYVSLDCGVAFQRALIKKIDVGAASYLR